MKSNTPNQLFVVKNQLAYLGLKVLERCNSACPQEATEDTLEDRCNILL